MVGNSAEAEFPTLIFNPGIPYISSQILYHLNPTLRDETHPPMHKTGYVIIEEESITETYAIDRALFDSGAQSDNYISQAYVDSHIAVFSDFILKHGSTVRLGDSHTIVNITEIITLPVSFLDNNSITHTATLNFSIMPMQHIDMIIGITSILFNLYDLFLDMLKTAKNAITHNKNSLKITHNDTTLNYINQMYLNIIPIATDLKSSQVSIISNDTYKIPSAGDIQLSNDIPDHLDYELCVPTWSIPLDESAPEEDLILDPCSFTAPLDLLSVTREEQVNVYYDLLISNINPDFVKAIPQVIDFMKGPIAMAVFCPTGWTGISGLEPLELSFLHNMPARMRTALRPIRPALMEKADAELDRMCKYMYVPSKSPITSPIVIAPKGKDLCRICGDYVQLNKYIVHEQHYIPLVPHELEKAKDALYFIDLDMTHAFHQIPLAEKTSNMLSVLTHKGNVRPLYMPEGISPATGILNTIMSDILQSQLHTAIVIHDNFLVLSSSFQDCFTKLKTFLTLCASRKVVLGMKKSNIGYPQVVFFGYLVTKGTYQLTQQRKDAVTSLVMPTTLKQIQSFLGATVFFRRNIPGYAQLAAPLNGMCTKGFDWDKTTWKDDFEKHFEKFKIAILESIAVTFPNYNYTFILRSDASKIAWGSVLIQVTPQGLYECIGLASGKWSPTACKWDIGKQEACAIVMGIRAFEYTLRGKFFIIETDHKNLLFMENDVSHIVMRWRIYIQGFYNCLRFQLAKHNKTSDWLTRQYNLYFLNRDLAVDDESEYTSSTSFNTIPDNTDITNFFDHALALLLSIIPSDTEPVQVSTTHSFCHISEKLTLGQMFASVHGGRHFHPGIKRTFEAMNTKYPNHKVPIRVIADLISECPTCQKVRLALEYTIPEEILHLKQPHSRNQIGIDTLTITPKDKFGNYLAIVIVEHFSKFTSIYPCNDHTAANTANAMFKHYCTYGRFDYVLTDPGSDLMSNTIAILNTFLGQKHKVSITERHESNGVEPTNKSILAHYRVICHDLRIKNQWSDPIILGLVAHTINSAVHSETGYSPMELKFGSQDFQYMSLPDNSAISASAPKVLQELNSHLQVIREISRKYQFSLADKRSNALESLNKYQEGDFVLFLYSTEGHQLNKLDAKFLGPYKVITHIKNDVTVRNLITDAISVYHTNRVKPFYGTKEQAHEAALRDADQYLIDKFLAYRGDPLVRTSVQFYILFADGFKHWKPWSKDLYDTIQYEEYCSRIPQLYPLVVLHKEAIILIRQINSTPITEVAIDSTAFLDIRAFGPGWYESINLPDPDFSTYVVPITYTSWTSPDHRRVNCVLPTLNIQWSNKHAINHFFVKSWGCQFQLTPDMTLLSLEFIQQHKLIEKLNQN